MKDANFFCAYNDSNVFTSVSEIMSKNGLNIALSADGSWKAMKLIPHQLIEKKVNLALIIDNEEKRASLASVVFAIKGYSESLGVIAVASKEYAGVDANYPLGWAGLGLEEALQKFVQGKLA